jgi:hypothetical protein
MANPKSLLFQLHNHWEVVEAISRACRELPALSEKQLLSVISRASTALKQDEVPAVMRSLVNADILQQLARSEDYQINPLVMEFVRGLTREHELGLSSVLAARVEAIRGGSRELSKGLAAGDMDILRYAATSLAELFRQISQQLNQDRHAILGLAEQARAADASMPLSRRYQRVLEAYDQYVEPINEMMDSGPSGTFYRHLEEAEQRLDHAFEQLNIQGGLYTHRLQMRQVAYQAKELRRLGRVVAQQCADTLLPLREELRAQNTLSASISHLLGEVRKKGLRRALPLRDKTAALPVWKVERPRRVSVGDEVLAIMAEARNYTPIVQSFPEELQSDPTQIAEWVDEVALYAHLRSSLPIQHLLSWLRQHYPQLPDAVILRLYHELLRSEEWHCEQVDTEAATELNQVRVLHYPHALQKL